MQTAQLRDQDKVLKQLERMLDKWWSSPVDGEMEIFHDLFEGRAKCPRSACDLAKTAHAIIVEAAGINSSLEKLQAIDRLILNLDQQA